MLIFQFFQSSHEVTCFVPPPGQGMLSTFSENLTPSHYCDMFHATRSV